MKTTTKKTSGTKDTWPEGFTPCCYHLRLTVEGGEIQYGQGKSGIGWTEIAYGKWGKDYLHTDGEPVRVNLDRCPFCRTHLPIKCAPSKTNNSRC